MAGVSLAKELGGTGPSSNQFEAHGERGTRRPLMYIGIGSLILLIILLVIVF